MPLMDMLHNFLSGPIKRISDFLTGRWYVLYVSGHGSSFKREEGMLTKKRALYEADRWVGDACTIGGGAKVENIFTGKIIYLH